MAFTVSREVRSDCCLPDDVLGTALRCWGPSVARARGVVDEIARDDLVERATRMVVLSWPCPHHEALPDCARGGVMTPEERTRLRAALATGSERDVLDRLHDALGDVHRRAAARAPYTCRPGRYLEQVLPDAVERGVAAVLITGVQAHRSTDAARWVLGGSAADAALYVVQTAGRLGRVGDRTPHLLLTVPLAEITSCVVTSRDVLGRGGDERWARLQGRAHAVLTGSTIGPEGTDLVSVVAVEPIHDGAHPDQPDVVLDRTTRTVLEVALHGARTAADLAALLDRAGLLPTDGAERAARLSELAPLWRAYRRSRQRWAA